MIITSAPQNEAVLSNVGAVGEFKIRNSAKAFNILSSGLYANKVRAIIRELSCNAVDSHVAAGKKDVPFDLHLPTSLEPWFAVRDYGTGLNHEQVTNIYTTYFESTKTASNDFIGALGLGSKSPFSYTDNFTVTAIKDGVKRIYSAFINEEGVPSIVKMGEEETNDAAGVEVKFSVNERWDFQKFGEEARSVFTFFALKPNILGNKVDIVDMEYETKDIIPGVHSIAGVTNYQRQSMAVMGNIAYPIAVPSADKSLGKLTELLSCGLVIHFDIGELDFQASREGLSYIPQTINAIKNKLDAVKDALAVVIATEANAIANEWERSIFLHEKARHKLWSAAVDKYAKDTGFELYEGRAYYHEHSFEIDTKDLEAMNISLRAFGISPHKGTCHKITYSTNWNKSTTNASGQHQYHYEWKIAVSKGTHFVVNDTKVGATERAKYHWRESMASTFKMHCEVYVLEPLDKTKDVNTEAFFNMIHNPPEAQQHKASVLKQKARVHGGGIGKNVNLLEMAHRNYRGTNSLVWQSAGDTSLFDDKVTYYYMPMKGFEPISKRVGYTPDMKDMQKVMEACGITSLRTVKIYGVRKGDLADIQAKSNWVNVEDHIESVLKNLTEKDILPTLRSSLDNFEILRYDIAALKGLITNQKSPFLEKLSKFAGVGKASRNEYAFRTVFEWYGKGTTFDVNALITKYKDEFVTLQNRYPLLKNYAYDVNNEAVAEYIDLIDIKKGV